MSWAGGGQHGGQGAVMAGMGTLRSPAAPGYGSSSTWHPTIAWMLGFVIAELVLYHILSHFLNI